MSLDTVRLAPGTFLYDQISKQPVNNTGLIHNILPQEVFLRVLNFLDVKSLVKASVVCRGWNIVSNDSKLWRRLYKNQSESLIVDKKESQIVDWKQAYINFANLYRSHVYFIEMRKKSADQQNCHWVGNLGLDRTEIFKGIGRDNPIEKVIEKLRGKSEEEWRELADGLQGILDSYSRKEARLKAQINCYLSFFLIIQEAQLQYKNAEVNMQKAKGVLNDPKQNQLAKFRAKADLANPQFREYSQIILIEDDVGLTDNPLNEIQKIFQQALIELPNDWDLLYLSKGAVDVKNGSQDILNKPYLKKVSCRLGIGALMINHRIYKTILNSLKKIFLDEPFHPIDQELALLFPKNNCFEINPFFLNYYHTGPSIAT